MRPANVISLDLRRAEETGDPEEILSACEAALASPVAAMLLDQVRKTFYAPWGGFWVAVEDEALEERTARLDRRLSEPEVSISHFSFDPAKRTALCGEVILGVPAFGSYTTCSTCASMWESHKALRATLRERRERST
jgi:hypothetical protein